jgi:hypothetical protein
MYARTSVTVVQGPVGDTAIDLLNASLRRVPGSLVVTQLPGRDLSPGLPIAQRQGAAADLPWLQQSQLLVLQRYALPNGRRYALLALKP